MAKNHISYACPVQQSETETKILVTPERAAEIAAEINSASSRVFRRPSDLALERIQRVVCEVFGVTVEEVNSEGRPNRVCRPRFAIALLLSQHTGYTHARIAEITDVDPKTVSNRIQRAEIRLEEDEDFAWQLEECNRRLAE